jgi:putative PIN family toxin of toxin-antitoxin system
VLVDANVVISSLLSPDPERSAAAAVMAEAIAGSFALLVPAETIEEVTRVASTKPWLTARIEPRDLGKLQDVLRRAADIAPELSQPPPSVCRDRGDDYLIAQAVVAQAEFLVTRDRDLLSLGEIAGLRIVSPVTFLEALRASPN